MTSRGLFLQKYLTAKSRELLLEKSSIIYARQGPKSASDYLSSLNELLKLILKACDNDAFSENVLNNLFIMI